jgi:predicted component of viral defense system (DUF524 family)
LDSVIVENFFVFLYSGKLTGVLSSLNQTEDKKKQGKSFNAEREREREIKRNHLSFLLREQNAKLLSNYEHLKTNKKGGYGKTIEIVGATLEEACSKKGRIFFS